MNESEYLDRLEDDEADRVARGIPNGWIYEDELPEPITPEDYDYWFERSRSLME